MKQAVPRVHILKAGQKLYSWTIIQRVRDKVTATANLKIQWRVECVCGKRMTLPQFYLTRAEPKKSCGCQNKTIYTLFPQEHRIWSMIHVRTEDPRHMAYKHYGGRGIKICDEWHKRNGMEGFRKFLEHVGPRPSPKHTIDRIDNDGGYTPGNLRWATMKEQRANQRPYNYAKKDSKHAKE